MKTNNIKAILVDDESSAIENLSIILESYCPNISVVSTANCVDDALPKISKHQPDVVFLDIEMPEKTGFALLEETNDTFQTIFVTAYDAYAINAFEVSAVDYLLKPLKIDRVQKAVKKIQQRDVNNSEILKSNIVENRVKKIVIPNTMGQEVIDIDEIICIEASNSYSIIHYIHKTQYKKQMYSKLLKFFEDITANNNKYYRSHRSWLINLDKVLNINKKDNTVILEHQVEASVSRTRQKELSEIIKDRSY